MAKCSVGGCGRSVYGRSCYCSKHYQQVIKYGKILKRTAYDPNEFTFEGEICLVQLYNRKGVEVDQAIIDAADHPLVSAHKWGLRVVKGYKYVQSRIDGKLICLHQFLLGTRDGTDHRNGNGLDNRRCNLRACSQAQNTLNRGFNKNNTSGYKGVTFFIQTGKWCARIGYEGKKRHIGYFDTPEEAALAYNAKAKLLHGEFAKLNNL